MTQLVLTVVGDDRTGLVQALADVVAAHDGNWERSELAELAGAFAGIVLISVPDERADEMRAALDGLDGLLRVQVHSSPSVGGAASVDTASVGTDTGVSDETRPSSPPLRFAVLGNDRPGIVRDVSHAIARHASSIDAFTSRTIEAPMAGGTLFEATVIVCMPAGVAATGLIAELERLAGEIQVDLTLA